MLSARERTNYPLTVPVEDTGTGLAFVVRAITPIDPSLVCGLLQTAVAGLVAALEQTPQAPLRTVQVLAEAERRQVLTEWNDTARGVRPAMLPDLFHAQAARTPERGSR